MARDTSVHLSVRDAFPADVRPHAPVISFTVFRMSSSFGSRGGVRVKESLEEGAERLVADSRCPRTKRIWGFLRR